MSTPPLRKDAARNWQLIVDTGRRFVNEGVPLQLNEVARAAPVGVATVYRHFPTPEALLETIATPSLEALIAHAERALADDDPWRAFSGYLVAALDAQLDDPSMQPALATARHVLPRTDELLERLNALSGRLLDRARDAGLIHPEVTQADMIPLLCGVIYAVRVRAGAEDRRAVTRRYLEIMLTGLRRG
ncbi:TetR/AcrR family transcriptional regulator [Catenuloplanes atrovinosus]|uniref:AcrR family transcriptional regulator n=1 Tax=Catenuloplanes atrovinosus TaxID=137266 RepID=A0AAE3YS71_9ACTN|nr:TetR/AcrR family transcriptional regulator [Catenuloplanes atrovinosus]MDR7277389.1 AcrR family transcriptional regulator [Catenuloplanes atrovinosus]